MTYDAIADAAYIYLVDRIAPGASVRQEIAEPLNIVLDFDTDDRLLGIEILQASSRLADETLAAAEQLG